MTGRQRYSHATNAIDLLAAAPLLSATSLAALLGIAVKKSVRLLDGFLELGIFSEVTHRAKLRLYGLKHLAPLREAAAPPRRLQPGRRPGRLSTASTVDPEGDLKEIPPTLPPPLICPGRQQPNRRLDRRRDPEGTRRRRRIPWARL